MKFCKCSEKSLIKAFGRNEYGFADIPRKYSNIRISRIIYKIDFYWDIYWFRHGYFTVKESSFNFQRNWKRFRKTQWKTKQLKNVNDE